VLRVYYFPIGAETLTPVTSENIDVRGTACVFKQGDAAEIMRILGSATAVADGEQMFTDNAVRVKIVENRDDAGGDLVAVVENEGVVRYRGVVQVLSAVALSDLKNVIESGCGSR
jgi:hypothetical protein